MQWEEKLSSNEKELAVFEFTIYYLQQVERVVQILVAAHNF